MLAIRINKQAMILLSLLFSMPSFSCKKSKSDEGGESTKPPLSATHSIIPLPQSVLFREDEFVLDNSVKIVATGQHSAGIELLNKDLNKLGITLNNGSASDPRTITISENSNLNAVSYEISINKNKIDISGKDAISVFHAIQTFRQYLWDARQDKNAAEITMKGVLIQDKSSYDWRVFHIDVARNFYTKDYLKKLIDWMALYKLNKLHLHLTDDQGWRIPIPNYPDLIEQGSWRVFNKYDLENVERAKSNPIYAIDNRFVTTKDGEKIYKASYTKAELQELVAYAAKNYIEVIPEVDMPGHMFSAIKAYPWLSATGTAGWGEEFSYPICPCKPNVKQFALAILDELIAIFPSEYIHIGNDEVDKTTWESSAICQQYMADNNLSNVKEIQKTFITELQSYLASKGRKAIVWDDATEVGVNANAVITYWRDWVTPTNALANGNRFVMTPWTWFYLSSSSTDESITTLYNFTPAQRFGTAFNNNIDGYQASVFTENIPSEAALEYYVFPRLQAFSEFVWANNRRDLSSFTRRLNAHIQKMDTEGVRYRMPGFVK